MIESCLVTASNTLLHFLRLVSNLPPQFSIWQLCEYIITDEFQQLAISLYTEHTSASSRVITSSTNNSQQDTSRLFFTSTDLTYHLFIAHSIHWSLRTQDHSVLSFDISTHSLLCSHPSTTLIGIIKSSLASQHNTTFVLDLSTALHHSQHSFQYPSATDPGQLLQQEHTAIYFTWTSSSTLFDTLRAQHY